MPSTITINHTMVPTNGIRLHVAQAGDPDAPLVILLHGFPEFWYGWQRQIPYLAQHGFRVWAPDQRGYNLSDKPQGIAQYQLDRLAADIIGLMDTAGAQKAHIVGHDWGGAVAWWLGVRHAQRVEKLTILNVPHPAVMTRHARSSAAQMLKSWYIGFFQMPLLPEVLFSLGDFSLGVRTLLGSSRPGTFSDADVAQYTRAWAQPGALKAMLNWYRAVVQVPASFGGELRVTVPTLMIWGAQDRFLGREMAQPSIELCDNGRLEFIEDATHWVQHEEPDQVNDLLWAFLKP